MNFDSLRNRFINSAFRSTNHLARSSLDAATGDFIAGIAIITLCCAAAAYIPVLGSAFFFLLPLPVLFYRVRFGSRAAFTVSALSLLIISGISGGFKADTMLMAVMIGLGFLLGKYIENHVPVEKTIAYSTAAVLGAALTMIVVAGNLAGTGTTALVSEYISKQLELMSAFYSQTDAPETSVAMLKESTEKIHFAMLATFPAILATALTMTAWIHFLFGRAILSAAGFNAPVFNRLNLWKAPDSLVWGVIACGLLLILPFQALRIVAINILIVMMTIYLIQGFTIMSFYFEKKEIPLIIRAILYGAVIVQQFMLLFVVGLGFFDTWFNLRRIGAGGNNESSS